MQLRKGLANPHPIPPPSLPETPTHVTPTPVPAGGGPPAQPEAVLRFPMTSEPLESSALLPNRTLRAAIAECRQRHGLA